jgi:hypothetical protein
MSQYDQELVTMLRALKGPPLSALFALLLSRVALGTNQIADTTGYSAPSIRRALETLAAMGLAGNHGRYNAWLPTARVRQLLFDGADLEGEAKSLRFEAKSFRLPASSSSSLLDPEIDPSDQTTTTTTGEVKNLPLPPEWSRLYDLLTGQCTTPSALARLAIEAAMARDDPPALAELDIVTWLDYCRSEQGSGIKYLGAFIGSRLRDGVPCPDWYRPSDEVYWQIERLRQQVEREQDLACELGVD